MYKKRSQLFSAFFLLCLLVIAGCMNKSFITPSVTSGQVTDTIQITSFPTNTRTSTPILSLTPTFNTSMQPIQPTETVITPNLPDVSKYAIDDMDLIEVLEPYHAEMNLNGFTTFISQDEKNVFSMFTAIDTSPASKYQIPLTLSLIYNQDPTSAQKKLLETKAKKIAEGYANLSSQGRVQLPEETWIVGKDGEILELGTASGLIEIYITMQSSPLSLETHTKFSNIDRAKAILVDIAAVQINRIKNRN